MNLAVVPRIGDLEDVHQEVRHFAGGLSAGRLDRPHRARVVCPRRRGSHMNRKIQGAALALLVLGAAAGARAADASPVRVAEVLCDGRRDPVGVDPGASASRG